jgi:hypothetical protein
MQAEPEYEGSKFLRNVSKYLPDFTTFPVKVISFFNWPNSSATL